MVAMAYWLCALGCGPRGPGSIPGSHPRVQEQAQGVVRRTPPLGGAVTSPLGWPTPGPVKPRLESPEAHRAVHPAHWVRCSGRLHNWFDSSPRHDGIWSLTFLIFMIKGMTETTQDAFDRGVAAGEIAARLANHDIHFASINGHVGDLVGEIHGMRLDIQRLADHAEASAKTVLATAEALRTADDTRSTSSNRSWTPWFRAFAVLSAMATILSILTMVVVLRT
jgi:hypothetical protein